MLKSMLVSKIHSSQDFLTWFLIGWQHRCQPIKEQIWKFLSSYKVTCNFLNANGHLNVLLKHHMYICVDNLTYLIATSCVVTILTKIYFLLTQDGEAYDWEVNRMFLKKSRPQDKGLPCDPSLNPSPNPQLVKDLWAYGWQLWGSQDGVSATMVKITASISSKHWCRGVIQANISWEHWCSGVLQANISPKQWCIGVIQDNISSKKWCSGVIQANISLKQLCSGVLQANVSSKNDAVVLYKPTFHLNNDAVVLYKATFHLTRQIWGIWKLRPAYSPETPNLGQNRWCFVLCDLEIWWMTLENNRASLLCCFKLWATFHSHWWIQTGVTVRKRPIWVKFDDF